MSAQNTQQVTNTKPANAPAKPAAKKNKKSVSDHVLLCTAICTMGVKKSLKSVFNATAGRTLRKARALKQKAFRKLPIFMPALSLGTKLGATAFVALTALSWLAPAAGAAVLGTIAITGVGSMGKAALVGGGLTATFASVGGATQAYASMDRIKSRAKMLYIEHEKNQVTKKAEKAKAKAASDAKKKAKTDKKVPAQGKGTSAPAVQKPVAGPSVPGAKA